MINSVAKVLEYLLRDVIYFNIEQLIIEKQHGFVQGRSTTTNLLCITQFKQIYLNKGIQVDVIYTYLSKAFDSINHDGSKLSRMGFLGTFVALTKSFLVYRKFYVECCKHMLQLQDVTSGVPQSSVLDFLLFNLFKNAINSRSLASIKIYSVVNCKENCLLLQESLFPCGVDININIV